MFVNNQWHVPGASPLTVHYAAAGKFAHDPSHLVLADGWRIDTGAADADERLLADRDETAYPARRFHICARASSVSRCS
ncbi:MAG: hypothetical protein HC779_04840 [Phyllobacteriaceae bacterium]|nr:hypothetical protein [Phyllobacteriaceae bacterium]